MKPFSVHPRMCGERVTDAGGSPAVPVHPRMCGERYLISDTSPKKCGSSPHVRGTWMSNRRRVALCRFIPACAGNVVGGPPVRALQLVHPRMCGERLINR